MEHETIRRALAPVQQVKARADMFFDEVLARHRASMRCGPGCSMCCQAGLSVLLGEALDLLLALDALPAGQRPAAPAPGEKRCPLLVQDRCVAYAARPLLCRTHGLPILYSDRGQDQQLSLCELNFTDGDPPGQAVLNASPLLAGMAVADQLVRQSLGLGAEVPERFALADLGNSIQITNFVVSGG